MGLEGGRLIMVHGPDCDTGRLDSFHPKSHCPTECVFQDTLSSCLTATASANIVGMQDNSFVAVEIPLDIYPHPFK